MKIVLQKPLYEAYIQKYYDKTLRFIHKATEIDSLEKDLPPVEFDSHYLEKLEVKELSTKLERYMFFGWFNQTTVKKDVEREIRRFVRGIKTKYALSLEEINKLHERFMENIKNYGTAKHFI